MLEMRERREENIVTYRKRERCYKCEEREQETDVTTDRKTDMLEMS